MTRNTTIRIAHAEEMSRGQENCTRNKIVRRSTAKSQNRRPVRQKQIVEKEKTGGTDRGAKRQRKVNRIKDREGRKRSP